MQPAGAARGCRSAAGAAPATAPRIPIAAIDLDDVGAPVVRGGHAGRRPRCRGDRRSSRRAAGRATTTGGRRRGRSPCHAPASVSTRSTSIGSRRTVDPSPAGRRASCTGRRRARAPAVRPPLGGGRRARRRSSRRRGRPGRRRPRPSPRPCGSSSGDGRRRHRVPATPTTESATTPRNACSATSAAHAARGRVGRDERRSGGRGRRAASSCARSRRRSAPRRRRPAASPSPATQPWAAATKPGSGGRCSARPPDRSSAARSSLARDDALPALPGVRRREPRRGRRLRAAVLVHEHRQQPGERRRVEPVEHATEQALGDQQVGLVEQPRQHVAALGQRPRRRRRRSRAGRARRARGRTRGRATGRARRRATSRSTSSRSSRSVCPAARIRWRRSGSDSTGWAPSDTGSAPAAGVGRAQLRAAAGRGRPRGGTRCGSG